MASLHSTGLSGHRRGGLRRCQPLVQASHHTLTAFVCNTGRLALGMCGANGAVKTPTSASNGAPFRASNPRASLARFKLMSSGVVAMYHGTRGRQNFEILELYWGYNIKYQISFQNIRYCSESTGIRFGTVVGLFGAENC